MVTILVTGFKIGRDGWPVLVLLLFLIGCSGIQHGTVSLEEQAQKIDKRLVCPVCPGETIDQSQVELARQMRNEVREKIAMGWNQEQILQYFSASERYGEGVLSSPPKRGFGLIAWVVPPAVILFGFVLLIITVFRMREQRNQSVDERQKIVSGELDPYLAMVDQELETDHDLNITNHETRNPKRQD